MLPVSRQPAGSRFALLRPRTSSASCSDESVSRLNKTSWWKLERAFLFFFSPRQALNQPAVTVQRTNQSSTGAVSPDLWRIPRRGRMPTRIDEMVARPIAGDAPTNRDPIRVLFDEFRPAAAGVDSSASLSRKPRIFAPTYVDQRPTPPSVPRPKGVPEGLDAPRTLTPARQAGDRD